MLLVLITDQLAVAGQLGREIHTQISRTKSVDLVFSHFLSYFILFYFQFIFVFFYL